MKNICGRGSPIGPTKRPSTRCNWTWGDPSRGGKRWHREIAMAGISRTSQRRGDWQRLLEAKLSTIGRRKWKMRRRKECKGWRRRRGESWRKTRCASMSALQHHGNWNCTKQSSKDTHGWAGLWPKCCSRRTQPDQSTSERPGGD